MRNQYGPVLSACEVRRHLEAMGVKAPFDRSPRLFALLCYLVGKALNGEADTLKETVIAMEFYGKGSDYDPQMHSHVRVELKRLRQRLQDYYSGDGRRSSLRIHLVPGDYTPRVTSDDSLSRRREEPTGGNRIQAKRMRREMRRERQRLLRYPKLRTAWTSSSWTSKTV